MAALATFVRRFVRAYPCGVPFLGMRRTRLPRRVRFGSRTVELADPGAALPDFVNVVLDDDYGLRSLTGEPRTIVDIGANIGLFTAFARQLFPGAMIHAYEPSASTARWAAANTTHPLTTVFVEGVASEAGTAALVEHGASNLTQTRRAEDGAVKLVAFPTVVERIGGRIDLLKIDCEGAEWDFMSDPGWFRCVAAIRMEYHLIGGRTVQDLHRLAAGLGFSVDRLVPNQGFGVAWLSRM